MDELQVANEKLSDYNKNLEKKVEEKRKVKVTVAMFGRETNVELDLDEVELVIK